MIMDRMVLVKLDRKIEELLQISKANSIKLNNGKLIERGGENTPFTLYYKVEDDEYSHFYNWWCGVLHKDVFNEALLEVKAEILKLKNKRVWHLDEIKSLLNENDKFVCNAIVKIYELQTDEEKLQGKTHENNGVGFNAFDAEFLSSLAQFILKYGGLTEKQLFLGRKRIKKYSKQLCDIANFQ